MREIKFRAWDKFHNRLYEYGSDEACILFEDGMDLMGMSFLSCQSNVIWMQYTGLKDKNGTEIYEGDVVKRKWFRKEKAEFIQEVIVFDIGAFWCLKNGMGELLGSHLTKVKPSEIEVIGNVYKNPELLEGRIDNVD